MNIRMPFDWSLAALCAVCILVLTFVLAPVRAAPINDDMVQVYEGTLAGFCTTYDGGECKTSFDVHLQPPPGTLVIDEHVAPFFDEAAFVRDVRVGAPLTVEVLKCAGMSTIQHRHIVDIRTATHVYLSRETVRPYVSRWAEHDNGFTPNCLTAGG